MEPTRGLLLGPEVDETLMHIVGDLVGPALRHVVGQSRRTGSSAAPVAVYSLLQRGYATYVLGVSRQNVCRDLPG